MKRRAGGCDLTAPQTNQTTTHIHRCRLTRRYGPNWPIKSNNKPRIDIGLLQLDRARNKRLQMTGSAKRWKLLTPNNGRGQHPTNPVKFVGIDMQLYCIQGGMVCVSTYKYCAIVIVVSSSSAPSNNEPLSRGSRYLCPLADGKVRCTPVLPNNLYMYIA